MTVLNKYDGGYSDETDITSLAPDIDVDEYLMLSTYTMMSSIVYKCFSISARFA
jgi:hypothetical protein